MKKWLLPLALWVSFPILAIGLVGYSTAAKADGLYNAREELEYTPHARMERQAEQSREIQFQQYQQQQYLQHERLMERQSLFNLAHQRVGERSEILLGGRQ